MKLYLVKSDTVKARYFFKSEEKATALHAELSQFSDVVLKYLETSDEYEITELVSDFKSKGT